MPESFTHGTSEQRARWFAAGDESGEPAAFDDASAAAVRRLSWAGIAGLAALWWLGALWMLVIPGVSIGSGAPSGMSSKPSPACESAGVRMTGASGTVHEIGLTYTVIRAGDGARYYVPNAKLASDTIRNATIAGAEHLVAVRVSVPLSADLDRVIELLLDEARRLPETMKRKEPNVHVSQLDATGAVVTAELWAPTAGEAADLSSTLRRAAVERLKSEGIYG